MGRLSIRGLIITVAVVGFDAAAMVRAVQQGRAAHAVTEYAAGFGVVLLILNLVILGLCIAFAKKGGSKRDRLYATPSPLLVVGLYVAVLSVAILSVLFLSGRF